jgi:hypothetical protein
MTNEKNQRKIDSFQFYNASGSLNLSQKKAFREGFRRKAFTVLGLDKSKVNL